MPGPSMFQVVGTRLQTAASKLGAANPLHYVGPLMERTFSKPLGDPEYAVNMLAPGMAPCEPSFNERQPDILRFTIIPLPPSAPPVTRRNEATRTARSLIGGLYGRDALYYFDQSSEDFRGFSVPAKLSFGAALGTAYDSDGLLACKVYYELSPQQVEALPPRLKALVETARESMPSLYPVFTSITCSRDAGAQRVTFLQRGPLRVNDLQPLLDKLGMGHQLSSLMQVVGLTLGGRFELPERTAMVGLQDTAEGAELKLEILLGFLPDVPTGFLDLLVLSLAERPREVRALGRWLQAFTPETMDSPGRFSVLSIRVTPRTAARVSLYLRPIEFEIQPNAATTAARA